ncbi:phage tail protein [Pseudomonas sichuanensis]|uniref:phage tail-collar fiber domain-containing protein n=1 Tax=Pseudomonas TaxID=286 RepID=UPI00380FE39D
MANSTTQFGGFLTNVGIAQQANTAALGLPWNITHMLIGDAGGEPSQTPDPTPKPTQSALVRQVYRAQLNALYQSPADPGVLVAELVLPPETGGWWIRELALEDANGNFIAVAKPAPSYKPLLAQGSGRTQTIRMHVVFGNLANVTLKIDPSIVLATRDYVDKAREAAELYARNQLKAHVEAADPHPQYLRRADVAKDAGPLAWLGAASGTADALVLTLKSSEAALPAYAAGQRFQFQAVATNTGAVTARINGRPAVAVKKAGTGGLVDLVGGDVRAGALYDLNYDGTYFQLGGGVSSGRTFERFSFAASLGQTVFNAPHSIGSTVVLRNGREVTDYLADGQKITFRAPCGMGEAVEILAFGTFQAVDTYTKAEIDMLVKKASALPVGTMLPFPKGPVPLGFLEVNGSEKSAAAFPDLAAYLGSTFNTGGEAEGVFRLPDSRGEFLRGWDNGRGIDPGRNLGSWQQADFPSHNHEFKDRAGLSSTAAGNNLTVPSNVRVGNPSGSQTTADTGGMENRPRNLAVMWCIKAWSAPVNQGQLDVAALASQVQALSLELSGPLPFAALDFPTVATADGRLAVIGAAMEGGGGSVTVPAGVLIALAEADPAKALGRPRVVETIEWTSVALPVNATLYLRGNIRDRALQLYIAPGTDTDPVPVALRSESGQAASGFDSTVVDVLLAKIMTGAPGSVPSVLPLANRKRLEAVAHWSGAFGAYTLSLNWARTPRAYVVSFADYDDYTKSDYAIFAEPVGSNSSGSVIGATTGFSDRYTGRVGISAWIPTGSPGSGKINARVRWEA